MKAFSRGAYIAIFVAVSVLQGFAQQHDPRIMFITGGSFLKGERSFTSGGDAFRSQYVSGGKIGVRGTMDLNRRWAVEGTYSFGTNNLRMMEMQAVPVERDFGIRVHQFAGNVLAYLTPPESRLRLFATTGLGISRFSPTDAAKAIAARQFVENPATLQSSSGLDYSFGAGVEARVSKPVGVRFDFSDHLTGIPHFGVPQASTLQGADVYPVSGRVSDLELTVGVVFHVIPWTGSRR